MSHHDSFCDELPSYLNLETCWCLIFCYHVEHTFYWLRTFTNKLTLLTCDKRPKCLKKDNCILKLDPLILLFCLLFSGCWSFAPFFCDQTSLILKFDVDNWWLRRINCRNEVVVMAIFTSWIKCGFQIIYLFWDSFFLTEKISALPT